MANSCDLMLFINHCGQFVKVGNDFEYYGEEVTSRYGFDKDRIGYFDLLEEVQKLGYTKGEKLYFRANNSRKYVHMHNDEGVMEMLSMMEPGKHYVQIYVDSGSTNESKGDDKQKGIADVQQAADDNVCEDSTDEDGEELDQFIDNFHEDSTDEEYVPEEESSESDGLGGDELGTDDEEYFEARRKRAESKKVADEETENFTLSSEKGCGSTNESDFQSLREDHSDYADSAEETRGIGEAPFEKKFRV
ncbi:ubiquitin-specific protease 11 [Striga asiatica]|uniref:Ubiquitin-specific protease 11 n=1 Tax=Striga asiatica TaxID=4170 RepID=A0A5A7PXC3_STRAF|nr:ubiquitin-specific protease 11 [Striga asiatica]